MEMATRSASVAPWFKKKIKKKKGGCGGGDVEMATRSVSALRLPSPSFDSFAPWFQKNNKKEKGGDGNSLCPPEIDMLR